MPKHTTTLVTRFELGRFKEAEASFMQAIELQPDYLKLSTSYANSKSNLEMIIILKCEEYILMQTLLRNNYAK